MRDRRAALLAVFALAALLVATPTASAQTEEVDGAADFRTAPRIGNGTVSDTVVTGEAVFYSVLYRNNVPYQFDLEFTEPLADDETATLAFLSPTLGVLSEGDEQVSGSARYDAGGTNEWFVSVTVRTEGQLGIERPFELTINGVVEGSLGDCPDIAECDADEQLTELTAERERLNELLAEGSGPNEDDLRARLDTLTARADELRAEIEEATPDDEMPVPVVAGLGLAAIVLLLLNVRARSDAGPDEVSVIPTPAPTPTGDTPSSDPSPERAGAADPTQPLPPPGAFGTDPVPPVAPPREATGEPPAEGAPTDAPAESADDESPDSFGTPPSSF